MIDLLLVDVDVTVDVTVHITVAIPTYNGEQRLPELLRRLQAQIGVERLNWEVLVVDNNSTDATAAIVQAFSADFPCPLRYCFESVQGAGAARQRAIREASSELIGFLDDDNWPMPDWVAAAYEFAQQHPQAGAYCSRISADYEVEPPPSFQRLQLFLAINERGSQPSLYDSRHPVLPSTAGLVVRKTAWLETVPSALPSHRHWLKRADGNDCSEDVEALTYMQRSDWEIWYNPAMQTRHQIPARRLERDYLLALFRSLGLSRAMTRSVGKPSWQSPLLLLYSLNDLRKAVGHWLKYRRQLSTDLVAACELQLLTWSALSPFKMWSQTLRLNFRPQHPR